MLNTNYLIVTYADGIVREYYVPTTEGKASLLDFLLYYSDISPIGRTEWVTRDISEVAEEDIWKY